PTGFLMLGPSEAVGSGDLFSLVDREHRIYARRETARKPHVFHAGGRGPRPPPPAGRRRPHSPAIGERRGRAKRGRSHTPVEVQPSRSGGGRGPGGARDSRQGQPLPHTANWQGELQPGEADSGYRSVPGG